MRTNWVVGPPARFLFTVDICRPPIENEWVRIPLGQGDSSLVRVENVEWQLPGVCGVFGCPGMPCEELVAEVFVRWPSGQCPPSELSP